MSTSYSGFRLPPDIVAVHQPSVKVHDWEQDAAATGVAHMLSLLLDEAGWGVFWRNSVTGLVAVRRFL